MTKRKFEESNYGEKGWLVTEVYLVALNQPHHPGKEHFYIFVLCCNMPFQLQPWFFGLVAHEIIMLIKAVKFKLRTSDWIHKTVWIVLSKSTIFCICLFYFWNIMFIITWLLSSQMGSLLFIYHLPTNSSSSLPITFVLNQKVNEKRICLLNQIW